MTFRLNSSAIAILALCTFPLMSGCAALQEKLGTGQDSTLGFDQAQPSADTAQGWQSDGLTPAQNKEWQGYGFTPETALPFINGHFSAADASDWVINGISENDAIRWKSLNQTPEQAGQWAAVGVSSTSAREWIKAGYAPGGVSKFTAVGLTPNDVATLKDGGFSDSDIKVWANYVTGCYNLSATDKEENKELGIKCADQNEHQPENAIKWRNASVALAEAEKYDQTDIGLPMALKWHKAGISVSDAEQYHQLNIDIPTAMSIKKYCRHGLETGSIVEKNPYTVAGRCYALRAGTVIQLLSRKRAVVQDDQSDILRSLVVPDGQQEPPVVLDFGRFDSPAEGTVFTAIVKGKRPVVSYGFDGKQIRAAGTVLYMPNSEKSTVK